MSLQGLRDGRSTWGIQNTVNQSSRLQSRLSTLACRPLENSAQYNYEWYCYFRLLLLTITISTTILLQ